MTTKTLTTPVLVNDSTLDTVSGGSISKTMDFASPNLIGFRTSSYYRPTSEGDGTTEQF